MYLDYMAARPQDIDQILRTWPYKVGVISARRIHAEGGREVIQMRIEMGIIQMETTGRPDGVRPDDADTYLEYLIRRSEASDDPPPLSEEECAELDREFVQFYHRRICWLALREFGRAVLDADHTLTMMDFAKAHSPHEQWTTSHEQYRSFVLFHRTQAAALQALEQAGPDAAVEQIDHGLRQIRESLGDIELEEQFDQDEQVAQLLQLKQWLREEYHVGQTLEEQLAEAVAAEQYERAAQLRDQIARRSGVKHA
jgi:hypothetical protein